MFDDPVEQRTFKADVVTGFLTFEPFMTENFFPLSQEFFVERGIFEERVAFDRGSLFGGHILRRTPAHTCAVEFELIHK